MTQLLNSVEIFAGGGGMALGVRMAGFGHLALVEWQKSATQILNHNAVRFPGLWSTDDVFDQDVRTWSLPHQNLEVDLVAGGPPCQPFSLAGVHTGDDDHRNMFPASIQLLRDLQPKVALFENVPGLLRPSFLPYFEYIKRQLSKPSVLARGNELWTEHDERLIRSRPRGLRYAVHEHLINAADFGVSQIRRRVFLVAIRLDVAGSSSWSGPSPTHSLDRLLHDQWVSGEYWREHDIRPPDVPEVLRNRVAALSKNDVPLLGRWRTIRDALSDMPEPVDGADNVDFAQHRGIGGARAYKSHSGSPFDAPAKTLKAGVHGVSGGEAMIRFDDGRLRYLTIREAARLQGFPDDYHFPVSRSRSMAAIGNAVAPPVAEILARRLINQCELTATKPIDAQPSLKQGRSIKDALETLVPT